ncbi:MAG: hypothetical protein M3R38_32725 [Actinomycetota bacterium]|nr:hypothetical protein [Actinomycetota bacterium]
MPGLVEVLHTEVIEGVRYDLFDLTGRHRDYDPCVWRSRADEKRKRVRMEKIIATVLREAHGRQIGEAPYALEEGPKGFYKSHLDR